MNEIESTQRILVRAQRSLDLLELQAAGFGQLHIPVHVQLELEEKRAQIAQLHDRLAQLQARAVVRELLPEPAACPYPGMQPFKAEDAQHFYGRDAEIRHLLQHLRHQRCIFVIGPSGSGKSSLIFAGLLPALQDAASFARAFWLVRVMRPGAQPIQTLTDMLGGNPAATTQAVAHLQSPDPRRARVARPAERPRVSLRRHAAGGRATLCRAASGELEPGRAGVPSRQRGAPGGRASGRGISDRPRAARSARRLATASRSRWRFCSKAPT